MSEPHTESLLSPYRVLDLTDEKGLFCGKMLGDLGADVIKIEKPGGDPTRNIGPFYHNIPDPEKSLYWFAFNTSKRGITLNIETADGQEIFKRLVKNADFVIESFAPGYMDKLGLGYSVLSKINPRIIMTSISPFGQSGGPYKDYKVSDLTLMALCGYMNATGETDRAPVRISFPQSYLNGAAQAAGASMIAHHYRQMTGQGQHVDVSILEVLADLDGVGAGVWWTSKQRRQRRGRLNIRADGVSFPNLWQCKDGYVCFPIISGARFMSPFIEWLDSEGKASDYMKEPWWANLNHQTASQEELDRWCKPLIDFFMTHTVAELYAGAIKRRLMISPVTTDYSEVLDNPQLKARGFWRDLEYPELEARIPHPEPYGQLSAVPIHISRRAPLIGEHNQEIYEQELGLSKQEITILKQSGVI